MMSHIWVLQAQQVYLQDHLSNSLYIKSKECEFIDELVMACNTQDADMLDKARMHPQVNYFDMEVKRVVKNISLFGFEDTTPEPAVVEVSQKANLFASKPKKVVEAPPTPAPPTAPAFIPPPPPPPKHERASDVSIDNNVAQDLDSLHIEEDLEDDSHFADEVEPAKEVDPFSEAYEENAHAGIAHAQEEDEDEIDLS